MNVYPRSIAMRRRARRIRRSVATFAVAIFSAAFLAVYVQLASGHDPALAASSRHTTTTAAETTSTSSITTEPTGSSTGTGEAVAPVTTSQS